MISQDTDCHVVNTASVAGLCGLGTGAAYAVSKYGVVGLSETLYQHLARARVKIQVSVLCPGLVSTRLLEARRNHPSEKGGEPYQQLTPEQLEERWASGDKKWAFLGPRISPDRVAEATFLGIRKERFFILAQQEIAKVLRRRTTDVARGRRPRVWSE